MAEEGYFDHPIRSSSQTPSDQGPQERFAGTVGDVQSDLFDLLRVKVCGVPFSPVQSERGERLAKGLSAVLLDSVLGFRESSADGDGLVYPSMLSRPPHCFFTIVLGVSRQCYLCLL